MNNNDEHFHSILTLQRYNIYTQPTPPNVPQCMGQLEIPQSFTNKLKLVE